MMFLECILANAILVNKIFELESISLCTWQLLLNKPKNSILYAEQCRKLNYENYYKALISVWVSRACAHCLNVVCFVTYIFIIEILKCKIALKLKKSLKIVNFLNCTQSTHLVKILYIQIIFNYLSSSI